MAKQVIIKGTPVVAANEVLVADSNSKIPAVDGSLVTAMSGTNVGSGTIATARLDTGTAANKIVVLDGSAKIPAVDGSLLTGIVSYTKSASDPTISTNPSGGVGTEWVNHTTGKQYICTDATAGANVWSCSGGHSGDVEPNPLLGNGSYALGGTVAGFSCGGLKHTPTNSNSNRIDRYAFASSVNSTDHADIVEKGRAGSGSQSTTHGYCLGGLRGDSYSGPAPGYNDMVQKFAFASGNASDTGYNLTQAGRTSVHACTNSTHAYVCGGDGFTGAGGPGNSAGGYVDDTIAKFALSADSHAVDHGNLIGYRASAFTASGVTHGFYAGGWTGARPYSGPAMFVVNHIQYFAYSSNTTATDAGDLTVARAQGGSWTAPDYGYCVGGGANTTIDKYSLTSNANATDVGDLLDVSGTPSGAAAEYTGGGSTSSTTHGYHTCGGGGSPIPTMIQRCAFASDSSCTDVGEMTQEGGGGRAESPYGCFD